MQILNKKICLLGAFGVGKTSLINRFVYGRFDDSYLSTIGVKVCQKIQSPIEDKNGQLKQFNFIIWDVEGYEDEYTPNKNFLIGAAGALIVSDLTREETIEKLSTIIKDFKKASPDARIVLIGNKSDLLKPVPINPATLVLQRLADDLGAPLFQTSAKTGEHVEDSFTKLSELLAE